jgi:hypothetical protein
MSLEKLREITEKMDPETALPMLADLVRALFPLSDQEAQLRFLRDVIGETPTDKVASLVHL